MRRIADGSGNPVTFIPFHLTEGEESVAVPLTVTAEAGDKLKATSSPDAQLLGRIGAGAFADLSAAPLVLSAGDNAVEVKAAAGMIEGYLRVSLSLLLPESSAAGWLD